MGMRPAGLYGRDASYGMNLDPRERFNYLHNYKLSGGSFNNKQTTEYDSLFDKFGRSAFERKFEDAFPWVKADAERNANMTKYPRHYKRVPGRGYDTIR
jgi:hypothetical protein